MSAVQITLLAMIALVFIGLAIAMVITISRNLKVGKEFRQRLYQRLQRLPYMHMLAKRDIDIDSYLAGTMVKDIRAQLDNCEQCKAAEACETVLSDQNADAGQGQDYSFCPNDKYFKDFKQKRDDT